MIAGIISDSHENMPLIRKAVDYFNDHKVETVLHAGDIISPITAREFERLHGRMIAVFGNNDGERKLWYERIRGFGEIHESPFELEIAGKKILLTHDPNNLEKTARENKYDVVVYGHTHKADGRFIGRTLVLNPGELGGWLYGKSTFALLKIPELEFEIVELV